MAFGRISQFALVLVLSAFNGVFSTSLEAERASEAVSLKLYRMSDRHWDRRMGAVYTHVMNQANSYCQLTPSACGLRHWDSTAMFNLSSVGSTVTKSGKDLKVAIYILHPLGANVSSVSPTQFVVNNVAVMEILTNIRVDIEHEVGSYVTYIGETFYGIPPDNLANRAIIPIAFIVLAIIIITALALHLWTKRQAQLKIRSERHQIGKTNDSHPVLKGGNVGHTNSSAMFQATNPKSSPDISEARLTQTSSLNEFREVDETRRHNAPLPVEQVNANDDSRRKEKKKKRKKSKKRHHRETEETNELTEQSTKREYSNPAYFDSDQ